MNFWYGIIREKFGKIRAKRISCQVAETQDEFLKLMEYNPDKGDVIVELDYGNHMEQSQFNSYVEVMYQSNNGIKVTLTDLQHLVGK